MPGHLRVTGLGPVELVTEVLRAGRHHTTVRASMRQADGPTMEAVGTFGDLSAAPHDSPFAPAPPSLGAPGVGLRRTDARSDVYAPPPISEKVELRIGERPAGFALGEPTGDGRMEAWARFADGRDPDPLATLLFVDALPPAVFNTTVSPGWTPTVELSAHCLRRPAPGWVACATHVGAIVGDYLTEDGAVWDAAGRLVTVSRQLAMMPRG